MHKGRLVRLLDAGLHAHPGEPALLALSGYACLQQEGYAEAEQLLTKALALGVEPAEVRYNLAFALFMQMRYEAALDYLSAPLLPFELSLVLLPRARCLHHLRRPVEAIADCRARLALADDTADANGLLALLLYEQGDGDAARRHAEAALRSDSRQVEALLTVASSANVVRH